jgi:hypothetical protein
MVHDEIGKVINSPVLIATSGQIKSIFDQPKRGPTDEEAVPDADRETLSILKGGPDTHISKLPLSISDAIPYIEKLLTEIERDFPELTMYEKLAGMSQVTGPAAERLFSNVSATVDSVAARHDQQSIKLFSMAVAIGGERLKRGDWPRANSQQLKFQPFDLDSYVRGDLDLEIKARKLFIPTDQELAQTQQLKAQTAVSLDGIVDAEEQLKVAGYSETEAKEIMARKEKEVALMPTPPPQPPPPPGQGQAPPDEDEEEEDEELQEARL